MKGSSTFSISDSRASSHSRRARFLKEGPAPFPHPPPRGEHPPPPAPPALFPRRPAPGLVTRFLGRRGVDEPLDRGHHPRQRVRGQGGPRRAHEDEEQRRDQE